MDSSQPTLTPTDRTTLHRRPGRGSYDLALIHAILAEGLYCHVGFADGVQPFVLPTTYARLGDRLYVHGAAASRMLRSLKEGAPVCVTVTLLDGLVLARSAFHHSMNYRSVVILGVASEVRDPAEKRAALTAIVEHVAPGRSAEVRGPSDRELFATLVLSLPISEASAKVRSGPPVDDEADYAVPCWAGVLPLQLVAQPPVADPRLPAEVAVPAYLSGYRRQVVL